ncbi:MAG: hypothetical protein J6S16_01890 [Bacteroidales bacterium]|nr:hypothetical protein [Bacteroidales bacterium]
MSKKITFLPINANDEITKRLYEDLRPIKKMEEILKKHNRPHDIEGIFQAVADGPNKELNAVMNEVEEYIRATNMPVYLQNDAREKARNSVNTDYSEEVGPILATWNSSLEKEDLNINESGEVDFTKRYRDKLIKAYTKELPQHLTEIVPEVKQLCDLYIKLNSKVNVKKFLETYFMFNFKKTEGDFFSHLYNNRRY